MRAGTTKWHSQNNNILKFLREQWLHFMLSQWILIYFFFRNIHTECWGIGTDIPSLEHDFVLEPSTHNCSCSAPAEFQAREFAWRRISLSRLMGIYYFFNVYLYIFSMYNCTEIQASWCYIQHFHSWLRKSSLLQIALFFFISRYYFL